MSQARFAIRPRNSSRLPKQPDCRGESLVSSVKEVLIYGYSPRQIAISLQGFLRPYAAGTPVPPARSGYLAEPSNNTKWRERSQFFPGDLSAKRPQNSSSAARTLANLLARRPRHQSSVRYGNWLRLQQYPRLLVLVGQNRLLHQVPHHGREQD